MPSDIILRGLVAAALVELTPKIWVTCHLAKPVGATMQMAYLHNPPFRSNDA